MALLAQTAGPNGDLHRLFTEFYEYSLREFPEAATSAGRTEYNDRWSDPSPAATQRRRKAYEEFRARVQPFRSAALNEQDQLSVALFDYQTRQAIEQIDTIGSYNAVNHFFGPHLSVFTTMSLAPARTVRDYENIVARLRAIPSYVDGLVAAADNSVQQKAVPPRLVAELVVKQLDTQLASAPEASPLLAAFRTFPASVPAAEQERLRKAATEAYETAFRPAWKRLRAHVSERYVPQTRTTIGLSEAFNGAERYRFLTRSFTTTSLTPEQIHEIGLKEVARIQAEMAAIRKETGFTGTAEEFVEKVLHAPEMRFKSEAEILAHGREIAKRIDPELPRLFLRLPRMPYGVKAIPADRARTAAPYYQPPALDGSRAGNFFLRTYQPETQSKCCLESLIVHEAVPGHHLERALAQEMEGLPLFRRSGGFGAYVEGWGLYAETLGPDLGLYQTPYERYGKLQTEIMRAVRLVVDTGIHRFGWSRDKAIDLMRLAKGGFINEDFIASEVDRYIAIPGQALSYKIGGLRIQELRARAEKELGPKFDVREFHDAVLRNGALPLDVLEEQVGKYIAGKR